jgi:hypothetical protein
MIPYNVGDDVKRIRSKVTTLAERIDYAGSPVCAGRLRPLTTAIRSKSFKLGMRSLLRAPPARALRKRTVGVGAQAARRRGRSTAC